MSHHHHHHEHAHSHGHVHDSHYYQQAIRERLGAILDLDQSHDHPIEILSHICAVQQSHHPGIHPRSALIFAGDHGFCQRFQCTFSPTHERINRLVNQRSLSTIMADRHQLTMNVINVGCMDSLDSIQHVQNNLVRLGTNDFTQTSSLTIDEAKQAMKIGSDAAAQEMQKGTRLIVLGALGQGTEISAVVLSTALLSLELQNAIDWKRYEQSLNLPSFLDETGRILHDKKDHFSTPIPALAYLGGVEMAAMVGVILQAASHHVLVLLDDMAACLAAYIASLIDPSTSGALLASHQNDETANQIIYQHLNLQSLYKSRLHSNEFLYSLLVLPILDSVINLAE